MCPSHFSPQTRCSKRRRRRERTQQAEAVWERTQAEALWKPSLGRTRSRRIRRGAASGPPSSRWRPKSNQYGWLVVNIKTTTTLTSDNIGNLATCVYAYTDKQLKLYKTYQNGNMSKILIKKLKEKEYNYDNKKDYYFVVVNKENSKDIIVNSVKGLSELTPNINNLPFQVCWNKNRIFKYKHITKSIEILLDALQKPKPSWKESFLNDVRKITL